MDPAGTDGSGHSGESSPGSQQPCRYGSGFWENTGEVGENFGGFNGAIENMVSKNVGVYQVGEGTS